MTAYLMHRDEEIFPDPATFDPSRWLDGPPEVIKMREKSLVPFSRGRRMCIGQTLAMCEIYIAVGTLLHRFGDLRASYVGPLTYMDGFVIHQSDDSQKLKVTGPA
jgi:cytochrome P450